MQAAILGYWLKQVFKLRKCFGEETKSAPAVVSDIGPIVTGHAAIMDINGGILAAHYVGRYDWLIWLTLDDLNAFRARWKVHN